ncbi:MAG: hypothetical protein LUF77_04950, partial [Oscillospiraceae bacterium]|nr:hypothetical protein [Oscillospiraceae bacterium]
SSRVSFSASILFHAPFLQTFLLFILSYRFFPQKASVTAKKAARPAKSLRALTGAPSQDHVIRNIPTPPAKGGKPHRDFLCSGSDQTKIAPSQRLGAMQR